MQNSVDDLYSYFKFLVRQRGMFALFDSWCVCWGEGGGGRKWIAWFLLLWAQAALFPTPA